MKKFKKIYIETTNVCNLNCTFCPKTKRNPKFMSREEFEHIINEVQPYTDHIYFHIMGEPLLNENIEYFLDALYECGIQANITTNGVLLRHHMDKLISKRSLRQVNISLHSFEANDNGKSLHDYINGITDFINKAVEESSIICSIRLWNMDSEELKGDNSLNSEILRAIEKNLGLHINLSEEILHHRSIKLKDRVYLNMAEKFKWPDIEIDDGKEDVFCYGLRNQAGILVDGTVIPCCLDSEGNISLGNIFEKPFKDILESDRAKRIYEGFSSRKAVEELCRKCGYAQRFKKK